MESTSLNELLTLERDGWESLCAGTGADFYGRMMTEGGVMILAHGFVLDRQQVGESLNNAPPWRTFSLAEERLVPVNDSSAVLVYRGTAWRETEEPEFSAWMATTYVKLEGQWRIACYQQTPLPGD